MRATAVGGLARQDDMSPEQTRILRLARHSLIGASIALSLSAGIAYVSYQRFQTDEQNQSENLRRERAAMRKLVELQDDVIQVGLTRGDFERLRRDGTLGDLAKTQLLDGLEQALHPFGDAVTEYKLEGQREFGHAALSRLGRHKFYQHRLELKFRPLHELEFLDIWSAVASGRRGLAPIESCEILRKASAGGSVTSGTAASSGGRSAAAQSGGEQESARPQVSRLEASCVLIAYTIRADAQAAVMAATAPMPGAAR